MMTLASLFDGSGGFPLTARQCGILPVWSSEIAKYPLAVTGARLPEMDQMGDIRLLKGYDVPPADIVTLGSPCQDVSNSGLQRGLSGSRSSLFFEALRLLKEMRDAYGRPSWVVFENVIGILSSCHGNDFRIEQAYSIATRCTASMSGMPGGGPSASVQEKAADQIERRKEELMTLRYELDALRAEATAIIADLPEEKKRRVMTLRYLDGLSSGDIALRLGVTRRYVNMLLLQGMRESYTNEVPTVS